MDLAALAGISTKTKQQATAKTPRTNSVSKTGSAGRTVMTSFMPVSQTT